MNTLSTQRRSARGVTLLEGLISTVILLTGIVGVLQGVIIASQQNGMANRHTRASIIAQELLTAVEAQGRARNTTASSGLFDGTRCVARTSLPAAVQPFTGSMFPTPPSFAASAPGLGWTSTSVCFINFDAATAFTNLTPGYTTSDDAIFTRVIGVFRGPSPEVMFVGVNVGWRDAGRIRSLTRMTAIYDTATNQTNLEY
jgi:hypothetical protein